MTEEQMLARRALQEAMDRRDNGGPPPEVLRPSAAPQAEVAAQVDQATQAPRAVQAERVEPSIEDVIVEVSEPREEPRLGVPFPRIAA